MSGFSVPLVVGPVTGQKIDSVKNSYPFLRDFKLADSGQNKSKIDLLIGADFYWSLVDGAVKRGDDVGLVALRSKLGWLLSGPVTKHKSSCLTTHTGNNVMQIAICIIDEKKIENFWDLDLLGIQENERSACKKNLSGIEFVNDRYEVKLPFKKNVSLVSDNYEMSQNRLNKLKTKLSQNRDNLTEYDNVMKDQLKNGIIEKIEGPGNP